jgi:glycosyltransferase involved in cell wall biosynthesis
VSRASISVIVPAYNSEAYLAESLAGVLAQTRAPDELIVVDDGSTDGTQEVLEPFRRDCRIIRQSNQGVGGAYNRGFAEASGDYLARCDADDIWEPDKLERQAATLAAHPEVDVVAGAAWIFGGAERLFAEAPGVGLLDPRDFAVALYRANMLCASSTLTRRSLFERLGPFAPRLAAEDYDFWLRSLRAGARFFYDPSIVVRYRAHGAQVTSNLAGVHRATQIVHTWHAAMLAQDPSLVDEVLLRDHVRVGRALFDAGDPDAARAQFAAALRRRATPRSIAWVLALSLPRRFQPALVGALTSTLHSFCPPAAGAVKPA